MIFNLYIQPVYSSCIVIVKNGINLIFLCKYITIFFLEGHYFLGIQYKSYDLAMLECDLLSKQLKT